MENEKLENPSSVWERQAALLTQCVGSHTSLGPGGHYQDFHEHLSEYCWPSGDRLFTSIQ